MPIIREVTIFEPDMASPCELPLYLTSISAGFPSPADDALEMTLDLNHLLVKHPAATFFVRVSGDSMIQAGIHSGDLLVVDRALEPTHNKIVIAAINGEFTVKRLRLTCKRPYLVPENPDYPILAVQEETDCVIWGVVVAVIHQF